MDEDSWSRNHAGGIVKEESSRKNMEGESWRRNRRRKHGGVIMEEETFRRHGGGNMEEGSWLPNTIVHSTGISSDAHWPTRRWGEIEVPTPGTSAKNLIHKITYSWIDPTSQQRVHTNFGKV